MKLAADDVRGVAETLFIPLAYRDDPQSRRFRDQIDYDWQKFDGGLQRAGIVARTRILDELVGAFVHEHRGGLVVNMGAGLDTRFHRLDDGAVQWLDVDLPEVIALREQLDEPASPRHALVAGSILDDAWLDEVRRRSPQAIMFVAEGLLPYFDEADHRRIFAALAEGFPGEEIVFHTSSPTLMAKLAPPSLAKLRMTAEMRWGLEDGRDVERLDPRVRYVAEYSLVDLITAPAPPGLSADDLRRAVKIVHARFV
ncbi:MAG TPA: class I SAM-dependent methyltransferase [Kofleriaceae bacterium]|jgi:O-methyltransferase involved in polyketide biosynthesis|nr:class I SAM-dependent methyltransferase [Kofleriaceae bacterium]